MKLNKFAAVLAVTAMALGAIAGAYADDASAPEEGHVVDRQSFEHYLALFNQKNPAAFEKYYAPNVRMSNGGLVFNSIPEVEAHYRKIWGAMDEKVNLEEFLFDGKTLAVQLLVTFDVPRDAANTPFGPLRKGERFQFHGPIFYKLNDQGKFTDIKVGYYSFSRTTDGVTHSMGMPH
ncbi:nuclear transport factor 2 family protein [Pseudomonas citronellolis]|uniref:nuclear transport factor 2 family protein n=1 Tax=Pseudomonas citronellolis TaxID=53408 RepID=UPI000ED382DC|nr:nuclear transport factor 2 family protein [Pseudomonas citronellolis]MCP1603109.1 hypothetical protein [Pseudomonas citronellolis]MCP1654167.1 hypothetical protein [Pseudomonas citronellolis]MCP1720936.1 hypothetical protein [Pseudomonas citronellolis]GBL56325.1 hypothetical protein PCLA_05r0286 [Pseudomonas citronellolis]